MIDTHGEWAYGDAFEVGNVAIFRLVSRSRKPLYGKMHYWVRNIEHWFDQQAHTSTLISDDFTSFGTDGMQINQMGEGDA